jgi:hypothetical protein
VRPVIQKREEVRRDGLALAQGEIPSSVEFDMYLRRYRLDASFSFSTNFVSEYMSQEGLLTVVLYNLNGSFISARAGQNNVRASLF